jgi:aromatic ring-cleaving dioxygenase
MDQNVATASAAPVRDPAIIKHYHAHIYYDPASRGRAALLRERMAAQFPEAVIGNWHDVPVGPHSQAMYQVAFPTGMLATLLPWLMLNRDDLTILVHPGTGNGYDDHTKHAVWLGAVLPVRLAAFRGPSQQG